MINSDDDTQQDMFDNDSDGEAVEEENDTDFKWRKERYEREQFIQEQQVREFCHTMMILWKRSSTRD